MKIRNYRQPNKSTILLLHLKKMNSSSATLASNTISHRADRIGVAASVLCAIHCALAPVFLLAMPAFGRIWAHPASHALVALLIVPLAVLSIHRGYRTHRKHWVMASAAIGVLLVLVGAVLPALSSEKLAVNAVAENQVPTQASAADSSSCGETSCESCHSQHSTLATPSENSLSETCQDNCCPSVQVSDSGKMSLHIPPAALVTTLGGLFLITAHLGNLCACGHSCRQRKCCEA